LSLLLSQNFQEMFGGLARAFERRYQVFRRRGHYWLEKRERELWRTYLDRLAEFSNTHDLGERAEEIDAWFRKERKDIDREKRRLEDEAMRRFCARDKARCARLRVRRERAAARRAKLRESRWTRWAAACADAVRRGLEPPPAPGARRRSGAPVRRLCRSSVNPAPSPSALAAAFDAARGRGRVEEKIRCGSLLLDLEATVDSSLVRTAAGEIAGRRPGLRGWIGDHLPYLLNHYASLMQYRRLAQAFREAHGLRDPHPATILLDDDAPAVFPQPLRARFEAARKEAKEFLATGAGRTMKDLRAALSRREWRRTG
ncbi:MAG: hypothetical protein IJV65_07675, partial [Kiritimatiellae bacterium]|nr:hypothetical protein [Kiritimatiellia bacterium]